MCLEKQEEKCTRTYGFGGQVQSKQLCTAVNAAQVADCGRKERIDAEDCQRTNGHRSGLKIIIFVDREKSLRYPTYDV